jgi:hypothetical protein
VSARSGSSSRGSLGAASAALLVLAGCGGGGDPLPAPGPDPGPPPPSGSVSIESVSRSTFDSQVGAWFTREDQVTVRGKAPAGAGVEARREEGGARVSTTAGDDGGYALPVLLENGSNVFNLRAQAPGETPGDPTALRITRRTTPPSGLSVDALNSPTSASSVLVQGRVQTDLTVILRVTGGAADAETTKPAGVPTFGVSVNLRANDANRLEITARDFAGNVTQPVVRVVVHDSSAPPAPEPDQVPPLVNAASITLRGRAREAVRVEVANLSPPPSDTVEGERFELRVPLQEGTNVFQLVAIDAVGLRSGATSVTVTRDSTPPAEPGGLKVSGQEVSPGGTVTVDSPSLLIQGESETGAAVTVSGAGRSESVTAGPAFSLTFGLPDADGDYPITVWATDAAGNQGPTVGFTVALRKPPPPPEEPPPGEGGNPGPGGDGNEGGHGDEGDG